MSTRDLSVCCSKVQEGVGRMMSEYAATYPGLFLRPIDTERTTAEQHDLYECGRTEPAGKTLTDCDGITTISRHQRAVRHGESACHACDLGVFDGEGRYLTDEGFYEPLKGLAVDVGLRSGWSFPKVDEDHVDCG